MLAELELASAQHPDLVPSEPDLIGATIADTARAERIAARYSERWLRKVRASSAPTEAQAGREAVEHYRRGIDTIAATENAEAWNGERESSLEAWNERHPPEERTAAGIVLFKRWDATLDRRTCPVCSDAEGSIRPLGFSFGAGIPGGVHGNCRCSDSLLPLPVAFDYEAAA